METKERIKDRLIKSAARLWNINENEIESNFDPIVKLLLDACAFELEKINIEMESSNARMVEKLVEVILPDALIGIKPSSGIMHAAPIDDEIEITKTYVRVDKKINQQDTTTKQLFFSPIGKFKLNNVELKYIVNNDKIFSLNKYWQKELAHQNSHNLCNESDFYIGLQVPNSIKHLEGLTIYFDYKSELQKELFYTSVKNITCEINNKAVPVKMGMKEHEQFESINIDDLSENIFKHNQNVSKHIYQVYKKYFIHLGNFQVPPPSEYTPPDCIKSIDESFAKSIPENIVWIKFTFPENFPKELLENLYCNINCFPVINKKSNEIFYKSQKYINIIPLETNDFYFDIQSILGSNSYQYHLRNLTTAADISDGEAIVRSSGIGRFDSREAKDIINYLLQIIRDETSTFSDIGGEMVANKIKELNQIISRIEDQMKKVEKKGSTNYLMLKPQKENESIFIDFWTTNGVVANDLKPGTKFTQDKGSTFKSDSIYLLTTTVGGKNSLTLEEKINLFRKYLLVKDRIVSIDDIKILCVQLFGNKINTVDISKGLAYGDNSKTGYYRTIDINIKVKDNVEFQTHEKEYYVNELLVILENNSSAVYPYRVNFV